jgi:LmbE family N-acetylglucosaminyl deacetylase
MSHGQIGEQMVKIAVFSPHRGDAAFALGLSVEAWLAQGHAVEVVSCFTRSEFAPYSDVQSVHANDRISFVTAVRKREDEAWRKRFGAAKLTITDLNLKDAPTRLHCSPQEVFGRPSDVSEKVLSKIRRALDASKAGAVVLPLGLSGHVDHVSARDAALSVLPSAEFPVAFYEELPYAAAAGAEGAIEAAVHALSLTLQEEIQPEFTTGSQQADATVAEAVQRKRRAAWCYDSQIDEAVTTQIAEFCRRYEGRERLWVNAAWRRDGTLMPERS